MKRHTTANILSSEIFHFLLNSIVGLCASFELLGRTFCRLVLKTRLDKFARYMWYMSRRLAHCFAAERAFLSTQKL